VNEADTDPALAHNRQWARKVMAEDVGPPNTAMTTSIDDVDRVLAEARSAQQGWAETPASERRRILSAMADELSRCRGELISAMIREANKTLAQADPEVSEAIDFARYYGHRAVELDDLDAARFDPFGVVAVIPPWNFPVAIPTGGVTAALAAGNAVVFKPAPETPRCAEIVAECAWRAGVPTSVLQFLRVPDDEVGARVVTEADAVILTGGFETAELFRSWKPDIRLLAETSGKNSLIITPNADIDLAVADLVASAFGHSGQKCSAASLAVCVGSVYDSPRLRRQLVDAVASLQVGVSTDPATNMGPTIAEPEGKLLRALTELDGDEQWLVTPRRIGPGLWSPGVRIGVTAGSWFHQTECFGPVLALMAAADLDEAIAIQNASPFGLTGGLHSLDHGEIDTWLERVEVGNAYVNRQITGAIVQRQPFGGWKRSSIGPGAKAGGPNYIAQLGTWHPTPESDATAADDGEAWLQAAKASDRLAWDQHFSVSHDPTGLFCEENTFRYRPLSRVAVRVGSDIDPVIVRRIGAAAEQCGVPLLVSYAASESIAEFGSRIADADDGVSAVERIRVLGPVEPELREVAAAAELHLADDPVTAEGSLELRHMVKEQAISRTLHRYGNLL
jgi:RHH-type proline utilization regulon transcriptional repressor/proline dehydrogenase/delta 1-pyrroline-5-carboxylate dehydrogenase